MAMPEKPITTPKDPLARFNEVEKQLLSYLNQDMSIEDIAHEMRWSEMELKMTLQDLKDKMSLNSNTPHKSLCNFARSYFNPNNKRAANHAQLL